MFDQSRADRAVRFFESCLKHTKGAYAGKPFLLLPWQKTGISEIFGTLNEDGNRQYREAYWELPKKSGKSEIAAGIALLMLVADNEPGAEIYGAAAAKDQAKIVFGVAASMVDRSEILKKKLKVNRSTSIISRRDDPSSFYKAIAADGDTQDGMNPHGVIIDELHRWKQAKARELMEVLHRSGMTRRQPLVFQITTAGIPDEAPLCWPKHQYARNLEKGMIKDPQFHARVYSAEPDEDWRDEAVWIRVNPSLECNGGFLPIDVMRQLARKADNDPTQVADFKRYHLNVWGQHEQRALSLIDWDKCGAPLRALDGRPCFAGLDISYKDDLTSLVLLFPDEDNETFDVLPFFWLPKATLREAGTRDKVPYEQWEREGHLLTTPGNVIDIRAIEEKLIWAQETFELREVGFDPWSATEMSIRMSEERGIDFVAIRQGFQSLSEPTKKVIELVKTHKLRHDGQPLLRWNADCVTLTDDGNGNIRPVKPARQKSDKRIDGMVALIMATDRAIRNGFGQKSVYEDRGIVHI